LTPAFVEHLNSGKGTWTAEYNFFGSMDITEARSLMGFNPAPVEEITKYAEHAHTITRQKVALPKSFDSRERWPACSELFNPLNQGACGSCWAFGATKSFSDRLCIATNATFNDELSEQEMVSCNVDGFEGCSGGEPVTAFRYIAEYGLPLAKCVPYVSGQNGTVPPCRSTCVGGEPWQVYKADILTLRWHLTIGGIMDSIFNQGPVEACFHVYQDFLGYKSGVYTHQSGDFLGGHCIILVGWGETKSGEQYWIAQNSWGSNWGQQGFFWIKKGVDECGIEWQVFSIMPSMG